MSVRITAKRAKKSPIYKSIIEMAIKIGQRKKLFSKKEVLKAAKLDVLDPETLSWNIIRQIIEEDPRMIPEEGDLPSTQLIPIVEIYTKQTIPYKGDDDTEEHDVNPRVLALKIPRKFIATGGGKTTAGYALITESTSPLFIAYLDIKKAKADGTMKAHDKTLKIGQLAHCH